MDVLIIKMILTSAFISLCTLGIYATTWNDMIFHKPAMALKKWLTAKGLKMLYKPICGCLICMSSVWTLPAWIITGFGFKLIPVMLCVAGVNALLTAVIYEFIPFDNLEE